ncbi:putative S-adenosylmethionine-dependent methyltransferase [Giardia muris]|uniref:Alpha N-terminal protein methyltransferase 1 n=1 Tax=Giardia muris TaxID=5742 RepID=A0A4Z1T4I5_GIAMU|nr:putative S-adenosylmethionine-dependent methyltransferase [Giardia muris]|eukprot:TNJ30578.1 putative S-adenosylmethionine-dependent methyltransferase [Giardia muris]
MTVPLQAFASCLGVGNDGESLQYGDIIAFMNTPYWYKACSSWYTDCVEPTIDGMLGGLSYVHEGDVAWSKTKLQELATKGIIRTNSCIDCGGGIGRVATFALAPIFEHVDLMEGCQAFVEASSKNFAKDALRNRFVAPLQDIDAVRNVIKDRKYDVVFLQWITGHLTDTDVVAFLRFAITDLLLPGGKILLKDNCLPEGFAFDEQDVNLLRSEPMIRALCEAAGCTILSACSQDTWPKGLYPIRFFVIEQTITE